MTTRTGARRTVRGAGEATMPAHGRGRALSGRASRFGLPALLVLAFAAFSLARPEDFATWENVRETLAQQTPVIIGGLAVMLPLLTGSIDLSVAANMSLANIVLAQSTTHDGVAVVPAIAIAVLASTLVGLLNGLIVERLQVNFFVATLGMATLLGGIGLAYSHSTDIFTVPLSVARMTQTELWGLPLSVIYGLVAALAVGGVLRYLPVGRKLRAVGANPRAAALTGIQPGLYRIVTFTLGGALAGTAGVVLTGQLGSATAAGSANGLLLPIFAAVFLGSTAFTPGRLNVAGLIVAALFLAFVSSGLVLIGAPAWESPLINGSALILAVAMSSWTSRLRARRFRSQQLRQLALRDLEPAPPAQANGTE